MGAEARSPEKLLIGLAVAIVIAMLWSIINAPQDTGQRVHGTILACTGINMGRGSSGARRCAVQLETGEQVVAYISRGQPYQAVTLGISIRRITRTVVYLPRPQNRPNLPPVQPCSRDMLCTHYVET